MKLLYFTVEGICYADECTPFKHLIEVKGGDYHPVVPGAVWTDERRQFPAMLLIWQGIRWPEGAEGSDGRVPVLQANLAKIHQHPVSVSRAWVRTFIRYGLFVVKLTGLSFVVVLGTLMAIALLAVVFV